MISDFLRRMCVALAVCVAIAACSSGGSNDGSSSDAETTDGIASASADAAASSDGSTGSDGSDGSTGSDGTAVDGGAPDEPRAAPVSVPVPQSFIDGTSEELFDQGELHTFELTLAPEDLARIDADPAAEEWVEGSLTFRGETLSPVGIRYKGSVGAFIGCVDGPDPFEPSGAKECTKLSMKVKVNWLDAGLEFFGVRRLQFHALNLDDTQMHERLGYQMFREMGVAAPRSVHARLVVNGEYLGVFALTEQIDGRFTRHNFGDGTGDLYKEVWPVDSRGNPASQQQLIESLRTNEDDPSLELMQSFGAAVVGADPADLPSVVSQFTDLDTHVRYAVVDRTIRNDDGAFHWYCLDGGCASHNFFWYEEPTEGLLYLVPWDLDNAFENISGPSNPITPIADGWGEITAECEPFPHGMFGVMQRSAACDPIVGAWVAEDQRYRRELRAFLDGPFSRENVDALLDGWTAQIADATAEAASIHDDAISVEEWEAAVQGFRDDLEVARQQARRFLEEG